ncbi:DUF4365 domain-containing protein [Nostoc sp. FACHB-87]|uniref:DUF4365 domain-containing protein n=1 Tax=Nostocales TaxID=1161 RepID=UPI001689CCD1|nr:MULTISPECIES: DUF4365 domain-containing protein [Nostocales]MBD2297844.1 DUF4365 domain-containing protein [Nostoc sp. FACHB-190]MBD2453960.1 DUF4365 domain-containing protein [Nostoc sp. FACHB-87]MBD2476085.1 DUF4365 domain-containing protein [Anabaena sp. FACHB-83]MBD2489752.1 DUF4365 domain-containing protein [Aulosira sp. FACHB-615]
MDTREVIGERGESIFRVLITRKHPSRGYLFEHPRFLGEKKRAIDFYVELFHDESLIPFFFVQVKSTSQGYTQSDRRLRVKVNDSDMKRLAAYPAPTYVIGIDEQAEQGYILSGNGESTTGFSSLCTDYPLNPDVLALLWDEVKAYWTSPHHATFRSIFCDPKWRK